MNQVEITIFNAIKSDNLVLFSKYIRGNENLCYGRFPLLSLCYLYNAKKIIKQFKKHTLKLKFYTTITEPYEIWDRFRNIAGRNMRLYLDDSVISPIEMLAILGKAGAVKKLYKEYVGLNILTDRVKKNLSKIYTIEKQRADITDKKISIIAKRFNFKQKMLYICAIIICSLFLVSTSTGYIYLYSKMGLGTSFKPYIIENMIQFNNMLSSSGHYILNTDLTLSDELGDIDFKGNLDGNGHTITIENAPTEKLLNNSGVIKNLNIVYGELNVNVNSSLSLFVGVNNGTIDSINLTCEKLTIHGNKISSSDIHFAGFATKNMGTINNCKLTLNASATASGDGEFFASGIAGINNGIISNSEYTSGEFTTAEVDVVGICTYNEVGATIDKCYNNATLSQVSTLDGWSPTISGISHSNYGTIKNCVNRGELSVTSNNESENASGNVMLSGISANNYGKQVRCLSNGNLTATSKKIIIYCGGISAYSSYFKNGTVETHPSTENCGSNAEMSFSVEDEDGVIFAGGLFGFISGSVSNCYSLSKFSQPHNTEDHIFVGLFAGNAYLEQSFFSQYVDVDLNNNFVANNPNANFMIGSLINSGYLVNQTGVNITTGIYTLSENDVRVAEVYFNE